MKCPECAKPLSVKREARKYGKNIDAVVEGVEVRRCPSCGHEEEVIPRIEEVQAGIAMAIAQKLERLSSGEIRFLRTHLGYSSVDFANVMGVQPETVSRWERGKDPQTMELPSERLLRILALSEQPIASFKLTEMASKEAKKSARIRVREEGGHWRARAV